MIPLPSILRALEHRNFRLYAFGQGVSLIGTWLQRVAMGWLAYRLTGSIWLLGLVGFCSQAAILFIAPFAGVLGDQGDKRKLMTVIQYVTLGQSFVLAVLAWSGAIQPWHLVLLASTLGVTSAFDAPVRQGMLVELIDDKSHLPNAIALNSLLVNMARVAGPAIAGLVVSAFSEAACFALNTLSFVAIIIALSRMQWNAPPKTAIRAGYWSSLVEAARYGMDLTPIRHGLILVGAVSWCISPYMTLMPVFAKDVFGGDANTLGGLLAAAGVGTIIGALYLAARHNTSGLNTVIAAAAALSGTAMSLFAWCSNVYLAWFLLCVVGGGMIVAAAGTNTIVQSAATAEMRGRIASFYVMAFIGVAPFGTIASATLADLIGVHGTFFLNGVLCCVAALWFKWRAGRDQFPVSK